MTHTISLETQVALLIQVQEAQQKEIDENKRESDAKLAAEAARVTALENERNKALIWGVLTLGSAVMGMAYWILDKLAGGHIK